jgi:hypothetical protein
MTVTEVLQLADELVSAQTGKHLDDIQKALIKGVWQGYTYEQIGQKCNRSESRVRDVAYKLWQILSDHLGEDINKFNFCSTIERLQVTSSQININRIQKIHHFNWCSSPLYKPQEKNDQTEINTISQLSYQDLGTAPKITYFYGRTNELETLSHWILNQKTRLIAVLGLSGIGKTILVKRFLDLNAQQFDAIIWRSLKFPQSLDSLLNNILRSLYPDDNLPTTTNEKLTQLFEGLDQKRCLIILDDVQNLFTSGQLGGQYQREYTDYQMLFKMLTEMEHQSCLILSSQEKCQEMTSLDNELYPVQALELGSLDDSSKKMLRHQGLKNEENWSQLIDLYEGNPLYIQYICPLIKDLFQGEVAEFIGENSLVLTEDFKSLLKILFLRLSDIEREIVLEISKDNQPFSRDGLKNSLSLSSMELVNGLQSLARRCLLKKIEGEQTLFNLSPVFREYVRLYHRQFDND